ncbi:POT family proton-dependent oligopeptide transporter [Blastomyces dermatitidis ATCC 18188]|uniref:POT family proton-dependent oligopeptide transporter n=1 Tax=Ajellomyces dermatitidis (strain ATCC 18188 / CBS 674.68) TaxID=653446 RepID=A0A0J9EQI2_AJEDA|nr:POT family proton-dependent oligopeptide transporter [Blastomyces dermatitidis ATCC 26199]KMW67460.1 POT family proton-dependent oligopeptide transporter [Blastomyces dermatitidis ATCC 18188]
MSEQKKLDGVQLQEELVAVTLNEKKDVSVDAFSVNENSAALDASSDKENILTPDGEEPTEHEKATLQHVAENLPFSAWLVAGVELAERFTYYGMNGLFQNYVQRPFDGSLGRGALGLGRQGATGLVTFFQFWCYVTPIFGAIVADQYLGKYMAIFWFCIVYIVGLLILTLTSIPIALANGAGVGGFIVAIIIIGIGTGGIKSNVAPLIADQYTRKKMAIKTNKKGQRVIIDPALTIQRIYMVFYACINLGSLSLLATPFMEKDIGFWSAYVLTLSVFIVGTAVLVLGRRFYIVRPPKGSIITDAFRAIWVMIKNRNMDAPKNSYQADHGGGRTFPWNDHFIDELKRALVACQVFAFYPIYWVVYGQFSGNFVAQAGQMEGHGIPNDLMQNFDPISIIVFIPILDRIVYPILQRLHIPFLPISRITVGFIVASLAMGYAAIVQHLIYSTGPCYEHPHCELSIVDGVAMGNHVHIGIQTPAYVLIGISEIFASVSGLEYAYTKAPPSMKSFVQSMYLLTNAFGSAIGEALIPAAYDPAVLWMFVGLCGASFIAGIIFWFTFRKLNGQEAVMNALDLELEEDENTDEKAEAMTITEMQHQ